MSPSATLDDVQALPAEPEIVPAAAIPTVPVPSTVTTAVDLLKSLNPTAADETRGRLAALDASLDDLIEDARVQTTMSMWTFLERATKAVRLRLYLRRRLYQFAPDEGEGVPAYAIEAMVWSLIKSVRRWADGRVLRTEQWRVLGTVRAQLAKVQAELNLLTLAYRGGQQFAGIRHLPDFQFGLGTRDDELIRRAEPLLESRRSLEARIARLDALGNGGRSEAVYDVIDGLGGVEALRDRLTPSMGSGAAARHAATRVDIARAEAELAEIDPDTRKHALKQSQIERLRARADAFFRQIEGERSASADQLVLGATSGHCDLVAALASALRPTDSEAADRLEAIITRDDELAATVAELLPADPLAQPKGVQHGH